MLFILSSSICDLQHFKIPYLGVCPGHSVIHSHHVPIFHRMSAAKIMSFIPFPITLVSLPCQKNNSMVQILIHACNLYCSIHIFDSSCIDSFIYKSQPLFALNLSASTETESERELIFLSPFPKFQLLTYLWLLLAGVRSFNLWEGGVFLGETSNASSRYHQLSYSHEESDY